MDTMENYLQLVDAHIARLTAACNMDKYPWTSWEHEWTGGNCDAYRLNAGDGYFMVTHDATAPITDTEWAEISLHWYIGDNDPYQIDGVENWETLIQYFTLPNGGRTPECADIVLDDENPFYDSSTVIPYVESCDECGRDLMATANGWTHITH